MAKVNNRVFIVQSTHVRSGESYVPKFDFTDAKRFGKLVELLRSRSAPYDPESVLPVLREKLSDFTSHDFILAVGNPILIGWATAIAADVNEGFVNMLQWSGKHREYTPISANIFTAQEEQV